MATRHTAVLADDHISSASAFGVMLERSLPIEILAIHAHAGGAVAQAQAHAVDAELPHIDLILLDIEMPGLDPFLAVRRIKEASPQTRVAFRSGYPSDTNIDRAIAAEADGFMTKGEDITSTEYAVRSLLSGRSYYSPPIQERIVVDRGQRHSRLSTLTQRELETLRYYASGMDKEFIAEQMDLSVRSVSNYLSRASEKLEIRGAVGLVRFAYSEGLITP